ncbi:serine/threonine protein kinase, partial [bacterium]|nr:serine/threonine protein kinase [bacterium]
MLAFEDLLLANLIVRRALAAPEAVRQALEALDATPSRGDLMAQLAQGGGALAQPQVREQALSSVRRYTFAKGEAAFAARARASQAVPGLLLDEVLARQQREGFAWSIADKLIEEGKLTQASRALVDKVVTLELQAEETATIARHRSSRFSETVGGAPLVGPRTRAFGAMTPEEIAEAVGASPPAAPAAPQPQPEAGAWQPLAVSAGNPPRPTSSLKTPSNTGAQARATSAQRPSTPPSSVPPPPPAPPSGKVPRPAPPLASPSPVVPLPPLPAVDTVRDEGTPTINLPPGTVPAKEEHEQQTVMITPKGDGPLSPGRTVAGKYVVLDELGRGGMGIVYRARAREHGELDVALKVVPVKKGGEQSEVVQRFKREILTASLVENENVCAVYDAGEAGGLAFMAMELVEGETLKDLVLREAPLDPDRALELTGQVLRGLAACHEAKVIHRDLKPENVRLTKKDGREVAKLVDFGIARLIDQDPEIAERVFMTVKGKLSGTPVYVAPELV